MKIVEKTNDVLTIQDPARDFWFGTIFLILGSPPLIGGLALFGGWWFLLIPLLAWSFCLSLQQMWASDVVKECSFNKSFSRITIKFHGLETKSKDFPLQGARVQVRETTALDYGHVFARYRLWLITDSYNQVPIPLSEEKTTASSAVLKAIAEQVQEFLTLPDTRQ